MAEALWRLRGGRVRLLTAIGNDADGQYLSDIAPGLLLDGCIIDGGTPSYAAVIDSRGECLLGLGDMALHNHITPNLIDRHVDVIEQAPLVVLDGNAPQVTIDHVLDMCHRLEKPVFFEPTDRRKATKPLRNKVNNIITYTSPNLSELRAMAHFLNPTLCSELTPSSQLSEILALCKIVSEYINLIIVTMGAQGIVTVRNNKNIASARFYPINPIDKIENVSGAGDCFASGFIHGVLSGHKESQCISVGMETARKALLCSHTVPSNLNCTNFAIQDATFRYIS